MKHCGLLISVEVGIGLVLCFAFFLPQRQSVGDERENEREKESTLDDWGAWGTGSN